MASVPRSSFILSDLPQHVCNDYSRFNGSNVTIQLQDLTGTRPLTLVNVKYDPHAQNSVSRARLAKVGVLPDLNNNRLIEQGQTFCVIQRVGTTIILESSHNGVSRSSRHDGVQQSSRHTGVPGAHQPTQAHEPTQARRNPPPASRHNGVSQSSQHNGIPQSSHTGVPKSSEHDKPTQAHEPTQAKTTKRPPRLCICGLNHFFIDCPYLIPANRPQGWQANQVITKHVNQELRSNTKLKAIINRFQRRYQQDKARDQEIIHLAAGRKGQH